MSQAVTDSFINNPEGWVLNSADLAGLERGVKESLFALGNGYIGTRGTEQIAPNQPNYDEGTYLNGAFYREKITYGESAYGFASHNNKILPVANGKKVFFEYQGETFNCKTRPQTSHHGVEIKSTIQLDLSQATLFSQHLLETASGKRLLVKSKRFVSQSEKHLVIIQHQLEALNFSGKITIRSMLDVDFAGPAGHSATETSQSDDPREGTSPDGDFMRQFQRQSAPELSYYIHEIIDPGSLVCVAAVCEADSPLMYCQEENSCQAENSRQVENGSQKEDRQENLIETRYQLKLQLGKSVNFNKYLFYGHVNSTDQDTTRVAAQLLSQAKTLLQRCSDKGWSGLHAGHNLLMKEFWQNSDISIDTSPLDQMAIRLNMLHLHMSAGSDGFSNIAAKGLSGPGYDGHYFWDSEIYVMPMFIYTDPKIARELLSFRYNMLPQARKRARQMSIESGALFPWRTIGGEECSAFFLAGTAQYHINAAINYAVRHYFKVTNDWSFICEQGAELVFETARLWPSIGHFSETHQGQFCIDQVTGPDEYTALVNNNFYTNSMAQLHLEFATQLAVDMKRNFADKFSRLCKKIQLGSEEIKNWQIIADNMYLPFDEKLGINPQDDSFLDKKPWDFENVEADKYPLLLNFHPLVIYRHQVLKQADVVLAMNLLDDRVSKKLKTANLNFYEPLTTHDSTLSACAHCIAYCEAGDYVTAFGYFEKTLLTDLKDLHHNTRYGVHTANMGGAWMCIVQGFAGLRVRDETVYFTPHLPKKYTRLSFRVQVLNNYLEVEMTEKQTNYRLISGSGLMLYDNDQSSRLDVDKREAVFNR